MRRKHSSTLDTVIMALETRILLEEVIVFMVSEDGDTGPCFSKYSDALALKRKVEAGLDIRFKVTTLTVDHSLVEGEHSLARPWHQPREKG